MARSAIALKIAERAQIIAIQPRQFWMRIMAVPRCERARLSARHPSSSFA